MSENKSFDFGKAVEQIKGERNLTIVAAGAAALIIGLFLPWYSVEFFGLSTSMTPGLNSTGVLLIIFALAAVAASLNVLKQTEKNMKIIAIVAGVLAALVMLNNWPNTELGSAVSTGIGYWLGLVGSVAMIAGSAMRFNATDQSSKPTEKTDK